MKAKKLLMKPNARCLALAAGLVVVLALALAAGVQPAAAAPSSAQAVDPVSVVDAFHAAGDDIDAALALLTDDVVIELNGQAVEKLEAPVTLEIVPGATHLFAEPGALEQVAELAREWFERHLAGA